MDSTMYDTIPTLILNFAASHLCGRKSVEERVIICLRAANVLSALTQTEQQSTINFSTTKHIPV